MEQELTDIEKTCKDCGSRFTFSAKDQAFFKKMVETGAWETYVEPSRCLKCRKRRQTGSSINR